MRKISVCLATYNEEQNITDCLKSVKNFTDEIIIVDGGSSDKTAEIAKTLGAQVIITDNPPIFHINKQKALDLAACEWILQLDADERVTENLADEIQKVIEMDYSQLEKYQQSLPDKKLFLKHQKLLEKRDGLTGKDSGEYTAFFIPRLNCFLGKYLKYGGVYPDGVIRLVKKGKAYFPCQNVHEQMIVDGKIGWLEYPLLHFSDPTFKRYLERNNHYIDLLADDLKRDKINKNPVQVINYFLIKPIWWFLLTQIRHKGILDGWQGIVFSLFSALRFPRAYRRYLKNK